jgi:hypothetical protein
MKNTAHIDGNGNIVVQGIDGTEMTIHPENPGALKQLVIDLGEKINELPTDVLKVIEENQDINAEIKTGANLYLTTLVEKVNYNQASLKFGLTITSLTKENRYFNQPFFKVKPKFEIKEGVQNDTFVMFPEQGKAFPKKLEYGEPLSVSYKLEPVIKVCQRLLEKDDKAYIQGFVSTTVGELYESNAFSIKKMFEYLNSLNT